MFRSVYDMKTEEKAVGLRLDRKVYERGMRLKEKAQEEGMEASYSTIGWFSYLIDRQLDVVEEKLKADTARKQSEGD